MKILKKIQEEGKIAILIAPSWKGQLIKKRLTILTIPLEKSENMLIKGKAMVKRELQLPPKNLNAYLLRKSFFSTKTKKSRFLTLQRKEKRNIVDYANYRE
jgi:hypothetical protein